MSITLRQKLAVRAVVLALLLLSAAVSHGAVLSYRYDDLNRLVAVQHDDGTVTVYTYDEVGNRLEKKAVSDTAAPVTTATPAGGTYTAAQTVALACSDGAGSGCHKIHFTTDGSTPTSGSSVYVTPLTVVSNCTLRFFATDLAGNAEAVKSQSYVIDAAAPAGTVTINGGGSHSNNAAATLSLSCKDDSGSCSQMRFSNNNTWSATEPSAPTKAWALTCADGTGSGYDKIYYTINGTIPTTASPVYTGLIPVAATPTLRFFAADLAGSKEVLKSQVYRITP